jgi:4-amino-4-deoxy-L-arabinose transferase-like glycosyltransferase
MSFMALLRKIIERFHLILLIILAGVLNIYNLWNLGYGNEYYAAAIKSMLTSFSNFFFLSFDSTGFISVDKSPLSLWVDAIFAKVFGFSGVSILIPHAIEGVLVTVLVYIIVRKSFGKLAASIASFAITLSPVNVAIYRNNTPDALLLVFILLAIFFIQKFFTENKLKHLILTAVMIGLGFNTKMLQAFLILPALIAAILIFTKGKFTKRIKYLLIFLVVTAVVSFSWITIVDLTPAANRPYVGSSTTNSAWDLAFNYNGAQRLEGESSVGGTSGFNIGSASLARLFTGELGTQAGWLLVSALAFSLYFLIKNYRGLWLAFTGKIHSLTSKHSLILISIIFMLTGFAFFSYAGFFHSYYLNIFALPIAFIFGGLFYEFAESKFHNRILAIILTVSLFMQAYLITQANYATFMIPVILIIGLGSFLVILFVRLELYKRIASFVLILSLLITPFIWSAYTTIQGNTASPIFIGGPNVSGSSGFSQRNGNGGPDGNGRDGMTPPSDGNMDGRFAPPSGPDGGTPPSLPSSSSGFQDGRPAGIDGGNNQGSFGGNTVSSSLVSYLKQNYNGEKYYLAVSSASEAEPFILKYDMANIMTLGGFSGRDSAITLTDLKAKIATGEIRFFYFNNTGASQNSSYSGLRDGQGGGTFNGNSDITSYVKKNCKSIDTFSGLYDCKQ